MTHEEIIKILPKNIFYKEYIENNLSYSEIADKYKLQRRSVDFLNKRYYNIKKTAHDVSLSQQRAYFNSTGYTNVSQNPNIKKTKPTENVKNKINLDYDTFYELYINQHLSYKDIGKKFNVSEYTIKTINNNFFKIIKNKKENAITSKIHYYEKTGYENPANNPEIAEKKKETNLKKYGVTSFSRTHSFRIKNKEEWQYEIINSKENLKNFILSKSISEKITAMQLADFLSCSYSAICEKLREYDLWKFIKRKSCSSYELEIKIFLDSINVEYVSHSRKLLDNNMEIDIFLPKFNIGIEFNGDYWHSDIQKSKNYHENKSKMAEKHGIRLIHIYQHEWDDQITRDKIKELLKISTNNIDKKIYARKCQIKEITNSEAKIFNNKNHLQNHRNAQITYGLFYNDELVQLMSFSKHKKYEWEIIRGCPGSNNIVVGGVGKLFNHFVKEHNPTSVFSYCDFNKFDGKSYSAIGMDFIGYTGPNKKWVIDEKIVNRNAKKYNEYSKIADGIIWGAGSKKFLWTKK